MKTKTPYTVAQVLANLKNCEHELREHKPNLELGPGYVRNQLQSILARGIAENTGTTPRFEAEQSGKITVFSLALDGPKCGTFGGAYGTESEAYRELVAQLGYGDDDAAGALLDAGNLDGLQELLEDSTDGLTTWSIEAQQVQSPVVAELLAACEALLACPDMGWDQMEPKSISAMDQARAAIAKAKGQP